MLSVEEIKRFISEDIASDKKRFALKGNAYYEGDHDIKQYRLFFTMQMVFLLKIRHEAM